MTLKLLVADDSVTIQKIVSLAFSGEDVEIKTASDGNSALDSIRSFKPDVVLADIFMPGCGGYEVCERIKENPELRNTPVILLVGTFEPFDESEAARVKCDRYLTKPFDTSELIQTVHALVNQGRTVQQTAVSGTGAKLSNSGKLVSPAAWDSFLGESRVLDLFDPQILVSVQSGAANPDVLLRKTEKPAPQPQLSEESINQIVERVVRRMSPEVIREVAWEVVPELSESIIRGTLEDGK